MNKINIEVPTELYGVLTEIECAVSPKYTIYVAGGFLRDTHGNRPIKDLDIMVVPVDPSDTGYISEVSTLVDKVASNIFYPENVIPSQYLEGMKSRGISGVLMGYCRGMSMESQLIVYGKHMTEEDVANDMDINICQIVLGEYGRAICTDAFLEGFQSKTIEVLNGKDNLPREQERLDRIGRKYPEFTKLEIA